jgi:uncharacterized protein
LIDIEKRAKKYHPTVRLNIIGDKDNNKLLELAETCKADFLITGNTNDFTFQEYKGTRIVSPKEYWTNYLIE